MRKYSKILAITAILFLSANLFSGIKYQEKRKEILEKRIKKELADYSYKAQVAKEEYDVISQRYLKILELSGQLKMLMNSSSFHRDQCMRLDMECRRIYDMTIIYLTDEIKKAEERIKDQKEFVLESKERYDYFTKRMEQLENNTQTGDEPLDYISAVIPELKKAYTCSDADGWNLKRGVFIEVKQPVDLPFVSEVIKVMDIDGAYFITIKAGEYIINYAYTGKPLVKEGETVQPYTVLFEKSYGNPVMPGSVIMLILRKSSLIDATFVCR